MLYQLTDADPEVSGLLALMLLTDARRPARTGPGGELIPRHEQDRTRWNSGHIAEGLELINDALPRGPAGPYQIQAAIAAIHDEAPTADATDWPQLVPLYEVLMSSSDNPLSRSTTPSPSPCTAVHTKDSACSNDSPVISASPRTTGYMPPALTSWK